MTGSSGAVRASRRAFRSMRLGFLIWMAVLALALWAGDSGSGDPFAMRAVHAAAQDAPAGQGGVAAPQQEDKNEATVRRIAKTLRCAVCQSQAIYESNSELAKDMLKIIRQKVAAGESEEQIRQYFYARYGDYIFMEPVKSGANWILWAGPFLGLLLGGGLLWWAMGRWRRGGSAAGGDSNAPSAPPTESPTSDDDLKARIQRDLDEMR